MIRRSIWVPTLVAACVSAATLPAVAEITSFEGFTQVRIDERVASGTGDTITVTERFPGTDSVLPLQVVATLLPIDLDNLSAAAAAAQFADPTTVPTPNPEEFAINLTLDSVSERVSYVAEAITQETRNVVFAPGELRAGSQAGDTEPLIGRLFLDGALSVLAVNPQRNLDGAFVRMTVTVRRIVEDETQPVDEVVFTGSVELRGAAGGDTTVNATGGFPTDELILSELGALADEFGTFRVLIIPSIEIDYRYDAIVGQPFKLEATVKVDAENLADQTLVAAVIGTPTDTLNDVIGLTQGASLATKVVQLLGGERDNPTGLPAFGGTPPVTPFGLCAPLGFASLFGLATLLAVSARRGTLRRRAA